MTGPAAEPRHTLTSLRGGCSPATAAGRPEALAPPPFRGPGGMAPAASQGTCLSRQWGLHGAGQTDGGSFSAFHKRGLSPEFASLAGGCGDYGTHSVRVDDSLQGSCPALYQPAEGRRTARRWL